MVNLLWTRISYFKPHFVKKELYKYARNTFEHPLRYCTATPLRNTKPKSSTKRKSHFVDWVRVKANGGKGGDGCISFMHLWCNPMAGPSGGDGGHGGHIIFQASANVKSLENIPPVMQGKVGENGRSRHMHGTNGEHTVIMVPVGTLLKENDRVVGELDKDGSRLVAARGGAGGHGNHFFLSNENRHPRVAEIGADGESHTFIVELKLMAHVGLVGFPNAGKSTLLRAISRARPKVAAYPFTTLNPHIGIVHYDDYVQLAVADLPGLINGAHQNKGLGHDFLRHIERCVCLLYVIDLSVQCPWKQFECLQFELEQYQSGLSKRPHAIVANKFDLPEAQENLNLLKDRVDMTIFPISAKCGNNVRVLLDHIRKLYDEYSKDELQW